MVLRLLLLLIVAFSQATAAQPISIQEDISVEGQSFPVPVRIILRPETETKAIVILRGDMSALQKNLPALLSRQIENTCETYTAIAITDVKARKEDVRISGQLQARRYLCLGDNFDNRAEILRQTANVDLVLRARIVDDCLRIRVGSIEIKPDGVTGALMNATGLTDRLSADLQDRLTTTLGREDNCLTLPTEFRAFDTQITGGGFRDFGDGALGAVIRGEMTVNAENMIRLLRILARDGRLGD